MSDDLFAPGSRRLGAFASWTCPAARRTISSRISAAFPRSCTPTPSPAAMCAIRWSAAARRACRPRTCWTPGSPLARTPRCWTPASRRLAQRHRAGRFRRPPGRRGGARLARPRSRRSARRGGRTDGQRADGRRTGRMIAVRFAPSPTGYLHVGNSRAALAN